MAGKGINVEGPGQRGALYQVRDQLIDPWEFFMGVALRISLSVRYVLIPWVGVMAAGFAFGSLLLRPDRRNWILRVGISASALFLVLRAINLYGNGVAGFPERYAHSADPWSVQSSLSLSVISFFNTLKYPPSLDYLLITLGPALILLGLLDGTQALRGLSRILLVFGRVPLFCDP